MAELVKARTGTLLLALPSGEYDVLVRGERDAASCAITLSKGHVHALALDGCQKIALPSEHPKSVVDAQRLADHKQARESWFLEFGYQVGLAHHDSYTHTLSDFEYQTDNTGRFGPDLVLGRQLLPHLSLLARYDMPERASTSRGYDYSDDNFSKFKWTTNTIMAGLRLRLPLAGRWVVAFAEFDAGIAFVHSVLQYKSSDAGGWESEEHNAYDRSFALRGLAGFTFGFTKNLGMYLAAGYTHAAPLENELGQHRQSGGVTIFNGIRLNSVKGGW
jgi:hypothetical protein